MRVRVVLSACLVVMVMGMTACNPRRGPKTLLSIPAAGSSFVLPVMERWSEDFFEIHRPTQVDYLSVGSGEAVKDLKAGKVAFAATDTALTKEQLAHLPPVVEIPEIAGAIALTYNLPGLKQPLRLSPEALAGIYLGTIKQWNDARLVEENPGVSLPARKITVVHRADAAGATRIFTTYLSAVSKQWKSAVGAGDRVQWPVGIGSVGSQGLTSVVLHTPWSVGFVELDYAQQNELPVAAIENQAGRYVEPGVGSTKAAVAAFVPELKSKLGTPIVDPPASAADAYPIAGLNFLVIPREGANVEQRTALGKFFDFVIHNGQETALHIGYGPVPERMQQYDEGQLKLLEINGKPIR